MSTQTYNIEEYQGYLLAAKRNNESYMKVLFVTAIVSFGASVVSLYFDMNIVAVILLAVSIFFYQGSSHHHLLSDMLDTQWSLALLINNHTKDLEVLRWEIKQRMNT